MKKYSRLYWAALLIICTLIPFLLFDKLQKSEALRFFESFVEPSELVFDENGFVQFRYSPKFAENLGLKLKYADKLEFDQNRRVSIDDLGVNEEGVMWIQASAAPNTEKFSLKQGCRLLKHMAGVWYQVSSCLYSLEPPTFWPGRTKIVPYAPFIFLYYVYDKPFYTLPSGNYYLFIPASLQTESGGKETGYGAAMIEIELKNLDGAPKRFDAGEFFINDVYPKYSVKIIGETLYHDPYA